MSLFQKSVVSKYLANLDKEVILSKWESYKSYFHNVKTQDNIKAIKEEAFQEGFIRELFVNILGFKLNPTPDYNFVLEKKNVDDSRKADGAIIIENKVIAVIELKDTKTIDLGKVKDQAFGYKVNQPDSCVYVITSNFEKLWFYIDNAIEHEPFNLFTLTEQEFKIMYLCLAFENISKDIPKKIKQESLSEEDVITKKLYKDYSLFKRELHQNLVLLNPNFEPIELYKKSQKLLDRFLFLFFGEDRHLLPPNSVRLILSDWKDLQERDEEIPLYNRFKKYFEYLNLGYKGKRYDVFAYNGGLFKPDEILDSISIDNDLLYKHTIKIAEYDFASEVDVNILGHIFENSLNELDEIKAQLEGQDFDKSKTKRKKDGVFYTPKYITKYIVENTVGKLCQEKKVALEIIEEEYFTDKKRQKKTIQGLVEKLDNYRKWLLQLTICDPACGSGAFLNQALDFLIEEHHFIDQLQAKLFGDALVMGDMENSILENNLFGVDLNEESVEIAKLSLWLRTAQPNRKLNDLNGNIKCGNSLIDDVTIAGNKAFNWQIEFPLIFEKGGFDVVIGNPPYVKEATNKNAFNGLRNHPCYQGKMDLWYIFGYLGIQITKPETGLIGYIAPNNWITNDGASNFRNKVISDSKLIELIDFGDYKVFESAGIQTMIYIMCKTRDNKDYTFKYSKIIDKLVSLNEIQSFLLKSKSKKFQIYLASLKKENSINNILNFPDETNEIILNKIESKSNFYLSKEEIFSGIDIGQDFVNAKSQQILGDDFNVGDGIFNLSTNELINCNFSLDEKKLIKPFYTPKEINRHFATENNNYWVIYTSSKFKNVEEIIPYPNIKKHLDKFQNIITSDNKPYGVHRTRNEKIFKGEKILSIRKCLYPSFAFVNFDSYVNRTFNIIQTDKLSLKYLNTILNSKLVKFWLREKGKLQGDIFQVDINPITSIPLINGINYKIFEDYTIEMAKLNKLFFDQSQKFQRTIQRKFELDELPKRFQDWYNLPYAEFVKELSKKKVKLSLSQEAEWEDYFIQESKKALELKESIEDTDKAIDTMVYELYELSSDEIAIIENS
jgi:type I restriction-modification system DNA methylase subunit